MRLLPSYPWWGTRSVCQLKTCKFLRHKPQFNNKWCLQRCSSQWCLRWTCRCSSSSCTNSLWWCSKWISPSTLTQWLSKARWPLASPQEASKCLPDPNSSSRLKKRGNLFLSNHSRGSNLPSSSRILITLINSTPTLAAACTLRFLGRKVLLTKPSGDLLTTPTIIDWLVNRL